MEQKDVEKFPLVFRKPQNKGPIGHNNNHSLRRLMSKTGHLNLKPSHVPYHKYLRFTKDFANTLVVIRWRWVTLLVVVVNAFVYVLFAGLWMLDAWLSGDFDPTKQNNFCISETRSFTGYLLLSIETITTTGYGYLYPTEHCHLAMLILTLGTIVMILIDGAFISVVFLKIFKPLRRDALTLFGKKAVICLRNGKLCLIFRINDSLNKHTISPKVTAYLMERTEEQDVQIHEIELQSIGMLLWITDVVHEIDENSPFFNLSATDFMNTRFEIFVTISGSSLVTNQSSTSQTSYLGEEIFWGYRFKSCMEFDERIEKYRISEENLFKITPCDTPLCSANKLKEIEDELQIKTRIHEMLNSSSDGIPPSP